MGNGSRFQDGIFQACDQTAEINEGSRLREGGYRNTWHSRAGSWLNFICPVGPKQEVIETSQQEHNTTTLVVFFSSNSSKDHKVKLLTP